MTQRCPICSVALGPDYPLSHHVAAAHSDESDRVTVIAHELGLPVVACDIDRIYSSAIVAEKAEAARALL